MHETPSVSHLCLAALNYKKKLLCRLEMHFPWDRGWWELIEPDTWRIFVTSSKWVGWLLVIDFITGEHVFSTPAEITAGSLCSSSFLADNWRALKTLGPILIKLSFIHDWFLLVTQKHFFGGESLCCFILLFCVLDNFVSICPFIW